MASSWLARASNMVLMSSRMCLVEVPGGLQWGRERVRAETGPWWAGAVPAFPAGAKHLVCVFSGPFREGARARGS